jgi:transcriptional regulator with XRE-family HTH domain
MLSPLPCRAAALFELDAKLSLTPMSSQIDTSASLSRYEGTPAKPFARAILSSILRAIAAQSLRVRRPAISYLPGSAVDMNETFGGRLRRLRTTLGITVVDLAAAVGAAEGTIRQIENGTVKMPSFLLGLRLADHLNVDPRYLALGEGFSMSERFDAIDRRLTKLEKRFAAIPTRRR